MAAKGATSQWDTLLNSDYFQTPILSHGVCQASHQKDQEFESLEYQMLDIRHVIPAILDITPFEFGCQLETQ